MHGSQHMNKTKYLFLILFWVNIFYLFSEDNKYKGISYDEILYYVYESLDVSYINDVDIWVSFSEDDYSYPRHITIFIYFKPGIYERGIFNSSIKEKIKASLEPNDIGIVAYYPFCIIYNEAKHSLEERDEILNKINQLNTLDANITFLFSNVCIGYFEDTLDFHLFFELFTQYFGPNFITSF
jgi:hypothetical protein